jgi:serine/threonine-protein kinase
MLGDLKRAKYVLEKGEDAEAAAEEIAKQEASNQKLDQEGKGLTVMFVESNHEMQNMVRDQLKRRGYRVLITSDPVRALGRLRDEIQTADCAVFSTKELGGRALAAFNQLAEDDHTQDIPCILLVDQRQINQLDGVHTGDRRVMLPMPLKVRDLRRTLRRLLVPRDDPAGPA